MNVTFPRSHSCGASIKTAVSVRPFVWGIQKFDNCQTDFRERQYYRFSRKNCLSTLVLAKILQNSMHFVAIITFLRLFQSTPIKIYTSENVRNNSFKRTIKYTKSIYTTCASCVLTFLLPTLISTYTTGMPQLKIIKYTFYWKKITMYFALFFSRHNKYSAHISKVWNRGIRKKIPAYTHLILQKSKWKSWLCSDSVQKRYVLLRYIYEPYADKHKIFSISVCNNEE
jgi:hypothetical protein